MSANPPAVEISVMNSAELDVLLSWASDEGWMPGPEDALAFRAADPEGFLAARIGGEMVAGISAVRFGADFAFLGLFIAVRQWRGKGIGRRLFEAALSRGADCVVGLDGVIEQQDFYSRMGFRTAHRHVRYRGQFGPGRQWPAPSNGISIEPGASDLVTEAVAFDARHFPGDRGPFMANWLDPSARTRRWAIARRAGAIVGLGVIREAPPGCKIGPLQAESREIAEALMAYLTDADDCEVFLDIPDVNPLARELVDALGMDPVFECARMYLGAAPQVAVDEVFGVATLELG